MTDITTIAAGIGAYQYNPVIVGASGTAVSLTGTTNLTAMATIPIPAGIMGKSGGLRITLTFTCTNSANNKTMRIHFGATGSSTSGTQYLTSTVTTITGAREMRLIFNKNSTTSQMGLPPGTPTGGLGQTAGAFVTSTVDTGIASEICISGQLASSGETLTLEDYVVEALRS